MRIALSGSFRACFAAGLFFITPAVRAQPAETPLVRTGGADALVGEVFDARTFGTQTVDGTAMRAFGIGSDAWNIGDRPVEWNTGTNQHAVIVQNLYRAVGNRFEQIGMSWAKHVVVAANMPFDTGYGPCIASGFARLGVNCGDLYSSFQNGGQAGLGPRFDVNPTTGSFTVPFTSLVPPVASGDKLARRLTVRETDVQAAANPGGTYFAEACIYTPDDSCWGNARNNVSSRKFAPFTSLGDADQNLGYDGPSYRASALEYWASVTPGVATAQAELLEREATVVDKWDPYAPGDTGTPMLPQAQWVTLARRLWTRYVATGVVTDNGDGTWTYDYAVLNVNSHRAGAELAFRLPAGAVVSETTFHAPAYHSGDRVRNAPWTVTDAGGKLAWRVDPATETVTLPGVGQVTLAPNALMFSTVYSFRVTVNRPPTTGSAHLGFWRAPADAAGDQGSSIALGGLPVPSYCTADVAGDGGTPAPDGQLNNNDLIVFIDAFFNGDRFWADLGGVGGVPDPDNALDNNDFVVFIEAFFMGCS